VSKSIEPQMIAACIGFAAAGEVAGWAALRY
jgi:hypothetical protein